jgi:hypothetical protein
VQDIRRVRFVTRNFMALQELRRLPYVLGLLVGLLVVRLMGIEIEADGLGLIPVGVVAVVVDGSLSVWIHSYYRRAFGWVDHTSTDRLWIVIGPVAGLGLFFAAPYLLVAGLVPDLSGDTILWTLYGIVAAGMAGYLLLFWLRYRAFRPSDLAWAAAVALVPMALAGLPERFVPAAFVALTALALVVGPVLDHLLLVRALGTSRPGS